MFTTLIKPDDLLPHLEDPEWSVLDCRGSLADPASGEKAYLQSHIPGAVYLNLETDLSAPVIKGVTGRHPLPEPEKAAQVFFTAGVGQGTQVVTYDDASGAMGAGRVWWMLRWLGFDSVAVLDGGWQVWSRLGLPVRSSRETHAARSFTIRRRPEMAVSVDLVDEVRNDPAYKLVDARSADRFHGLNETIDPVAGHIPGAVNFPYKDNLTEDGMFRPIDELRQKYRALLGNTPAKKVIFYCGSGVTAIHDILAMAAAGLGEPRLYPGSWSEWITDPKRLIGRD